MNTLKCIFGYFIGEMYCTVAENCMNIQSDVIRIMHERFTNITFCVGKRNSIATEIYYYTF